MIIEKNNSGFFKRILNQGLNFVTVAAIILIALLYINFNDGWLFPLRLILGLYSAFFIYSFVQIVLMNKYLITRIESKVDNLNIHFYCFRRPQMREYKMENIKIKIDFESLNTRGGKRYVLILKNKDEIICKQYQIGGWQISEFKALFYEIKSLQGKTGYINSVCE